MSHPGEPGIDRHQADPGLITIKADGLPRGTLRARTTGTPIVGSILLHWLSLLYFMAPAYLGNMAPPFVRYWKGWNRPIHPRLLGRHKTVLGFALGVIVAVLVTGLQAALALPFGLTDYTGWPLLGLGFGVGAMAGDALKSLLKRQLRIAPGRPWPPCDQIDFVLGSLLLVAGRTGLSGWEMLLIVGSSFVGDVLVNRLAFRLGVKDSPW